MFEFNTILSLIYGICLLIPDLLLGCLPTATKFKVLGVLTAMEILKFINKNA